MFSFQFSDFNVPRNRTPRFSQLLSLPPLEAVEQRKAYVSDEIKRTLKAEIFSILEQLLRQNPFGKTFVTTAQLVRQSKERNDGKIPRFRVFIKIEF